MDVYGHGRPTRIAHVGESVKIEHYIEPLPVAENINRCVFEVPWFKHFRPEIIEEHVIPQTKGPPIALNDASGDI